ncbi:hypothetical protein [Paenibacillus segetis]|uniref:hypothetical protein n=1 Tax=Paenibacillus segetis TaxID=1325360 RepID=UPI00227BF944|nr:hypothetical protein [Paenibacillus segetis]
MTIACLKKINGPHKVDPMNLILTSAAAAALSLLAFLNGTIRESLYAGQRFIKFNTSAESSRQTPKVNALLGGDRAQVRSKAFQRIAGLIL